MATIDSVKLPDNSTYDLTDNHSGYQKETLTTPLTINGTQETTVEGALGGLNDYGDALADNLAANEKSGAKNRNVYPYKDTTKTENGVTFIDNGNGTITASAASYPYTVPSDTSFFCSYFMDNEFKAGTWTLNGSPVVSDDVYINYVVHHGGEYLNYLDKGQGVTFTQAVDTKDVALCITLKAGYVLTGVLFFQPMLRDARITDPTFAPYAKTNQQLTKDVSGVSNRNFVDNAFFTINQRGATTVTSGYGADRWLFGGGVSGSNIVFATGSATLTNVQMQQYFKKQIPNGVYTLSVKKLDGKIYYGTIYKTDDVSLFEAVNNADVYVAYNAQYKSFVVSTYGKNTNTFVATKLEVGSVSTLHLDTAPDDTTELLKCQRYFYRMTQSVVTAQMALVMGFDGTNTYGIIKTPVPMVSTPTLSFAGTFNLSDATNTYPVTNMSLTAYGGDTGTLFAQAIGGGIIVSKMYVLMCGSSNAYIDLSADL